MFSKNIGRSIGGFIASISSINIEPPIPPSSASAYNYSDLVVGIDLIGIDPTVDNVQVQYAANEAGPYTNCLKVSSFTPDVNISYYILLASGFWHLRTRYHTPIGWSAWTNLGSIVPSGLATATIDGNSPYPEGVIPGDVGNSSAWEYDVLDKYKINLLTSSSMDYSMFTDVYVDVFSTGDVLLASGITSPSSPVQSEYTSDYDGEFEVYCKIRIGGEPATGPYLDDLTTSPLTIKVPLCPPLEILTASIAVDAGIGAITNQLEWNIAPNPTNITEQVIYLECSPNMNPSSYNYYVTENTGILIISESPTTLPQIGDPYVYSIYSVGTNNLSAAITISGSVSAA